MPRARTIQTSWTSGELDPLLAARADIKHYYNGGDRMRNVLALPQGGFKRWWGTLYKTALHPVVSQHSLSGGGVTVTAPHGGTAANAYDANEATLVTSTDNLSTTNPYVLVHVDLGVAQTIRFADCVLLSITAGTSSAEWVIQYSTDDAAWTDFGNKIDTVDTTPRTRRFSGTGPVSARYWRLTRIGSPDLGTAKAKVAEFRLWTSSATLSESQLVRFEFSTTQAYMMLFTDRNMAVFKDGVKQCDVASPYTSAELLVDTSAEPLTYTGIGWTQNLDTLVVFHEDHPTRYFQRQGAHDEWHPADWTFNNVPTNPFERVTAATMTPGATGPAAGVTLTSTDFVAGDVGKCVRGNGGYARITAVNAGVSCTATVVNGFTNTNAVAAAAWTIEEAVWSATRGYPRSGTFFQGRFCIAGSKSRPQSLWCSRAGNYNDFDIGSAQDDEAIEANADTDDVSAFYQIIPGRHLQLFSSSAEFYVPISNDEGITPNNVVLRRTTKRGIKRGLRPFDLDGATMFMQRQGKALREFIFVDTEQAYQANNLSLLSSHLVVDPVSMDLRSATSTDEADYLFMVNSDGTLAAFTTLRTQQVNAFTVRETDGLFLNVGVDRTTVYAVVERTINGATVRYLEQADDDVLVDCGVSVTSGMPASGATGLDHIEGESARVILDGAQQANLTVASGAVTFERDAETSYQIGVAFPDVSDDASGKEVFVRTMPIEPNLPDGTVVGRRKRIVSVTLRLRDTSHVIVNDNYVPFRRLGADLLDEPVPSFSGDKKIKGLLGWDDQGQVTISQQDSQPLTVLGVQSTVAV